jgi:FkbM family methyltransferase
VQKEAGLVLIDSSLGSFWLREAGTGMNGLQLLEYLIGSHETTAAEARDLGVRPGDTVVDCGAHVGVFVRMSLRKGAARVIAIEPDPVNLECLRRNFRTEIESGKVVLYPKGVWDKVDRLTFDLSPENSGMNSVAVARGQNRIQIDVTTLDNIVKELRVDKVDFVKMDIEGAERNALAGAAGLLRAQRPRLMLDSYHRPDDMPVFRSLLLPLGYREKVIVGCVRCDQKPDVLVPGVTFWE